MTVEEIFRDISAHQIRGIMMHDQLADYYDFLNLHGYKRFHEYHMICELKSMRKIHRYFINHFGKLIEEVPVENPDVIPSIWSRYTREDVDTNTKRSAVKTAVEKWVAWEKETKALCEKMYSELMSIGEAAAAEKVCYLVYDVDKELKWAQRKHINLTSVDYSINYILGEQDRLHDWYKKRMWTHDKHGRNKK